MLCDAYICPPVDDGEGSLTSLEVDVVRHPYNGSIWRSSRNLNYQNRTHSVSPCTLASTTHLNCSTAAYWLIADLSKWCSVVAALTLDDSFHL
jgi:hypothetical protein